MTPAIALFLCLSAQVYDGDSLKCADGLRVRLWGVSAIELRDPGGKEAREALRSIAGGKDLLCELKGASAGRVVALCRPLGEDVAREMVERKQATDWPKYSGGYYSARGLDEDLSRCAGEARCIGSEGVAE